MKAFVICIRGHADSERCAQRCIDSAAKFGLKVERFDAITPADDPEAMFRARGWPTDRFTNNRFSRPLPCMACFLSHSELWHQCAYSGESMIVFEHDAVVVRAIPRIHRAAMLCNLGKPSFGGFNVPTVPLGPLVSKPFVPGAHAIYMTQPGAAKLLEKAATDAQPTDVYMSLRRFSFIKEIYPWPVECRDSFSTVQGPEGIRGKHNKVLIL